MTMGDLKLFGTVEVDEVYLEKMKSLRTKAGVPKALGIVQRGGGAKAIIMEKIGKYNTVPLIKNEVELGSNIMTDMAAVFRSKSLSDYNHNAVNHSAGEYVFGEVHTGTVDGFFSQIKRSIDGTYHRVSKKHLQSYLDEFSFRLTHSRTGIPVFLVLLRQLVRQ